MTEQKPLTYDEHKAAEAAFRGLPPNPDWTGSAQRIYARLAAAVQKRSLEEGRPAALRSCDWVSL